TRDWKLRLDGAVRRRVESARRGFLLCPVSLDSEKLQAYGTAGAATGKQPTPLRRDPCSVHPLRPALTPWSALAASIAKSVKGRCHETTYLRLGNSGDLLERSHSCRERSSER